MNQQKQQAIELSVQIAAPRETVFRFFSDPARYKLWMGEQSTMSPGAAGRLTVSFGPGPTALGKIVEWREPERIVFDWSHEGGPEAEPSRVTITLRKTDDGTIVSLRHEGIVEQVQREGTASGWRYYLSTLNSVALGEHLSQAAAGIIEKYFYAWSQTDPVQRAAMFSSCVSANVRFRDRYGAIDGRDNLNNYVGGVQRMMGSAQILPGGPMDRVQNFFRQNWVVEGPDKATLFRGQNLYEFDAHARLMLIVGFWE